MNYSPGTVSPRNLDIGPKMRTKSLAHPEEMQAISSQLVLYCVKVQFHYPVHKRILLKSREHRSERAGLTPSLGEEVEIKRTNTRQQALDMTCVVYFSVVADFFLSCCVIACLLCQLNEL